MTASSHERYRDALIALADDAAILPIASQAGVQFGWWTRERTWRRMYGRFMPDVEPLVEIVLASDAPSQELCRIDIFEHRPDGRGGCDDICRIDAADAWARVTRFPSDSDLPGLMTLNDGATVMRYHPGRRCTLRTMHGERALVAKVYDTDTGARVYCDLVALQRARSQGELHVRVAEPLAWDASTRTLWQAALGGQPATIGLRSRQGDDLARRMGMAAGSLTRTNVTPTAVFDGTAALARSCRHANELVRRVPSLDSMVNAIVDRLAGMHGRFPSRALRPIHGAPHPDHWLDAGSDLGLIDFDRFSRGDPEWDAGVVIADLDALNDPAVPPERLSAAFLEGYRAAGVALCAPLVQAYRAHRQLAKALRAAQAIRPDGDRRAERAALRANRILKEALPA